MKRVGTAVALALLASTALTMGTAAGQETSGTGTVKGKATLTKKGIPEATVVLKPGRCERARERTAHGQDELEGHLQGHERPSRNVQGGTHDHGAPEEGP